MLFKAILFLHIISVIVWVGGLLTLLVVSLRLSRERSAAVHEFFGGISGFIGGAVFGPASVLTLLTGIALIWLYGWVTPLWVIWGFCAFLISSVIGAVCIGRTARALKALMASGNAEATTVGVLHRRLKVWNVLNILVLLSAVWVMTFK